MMKLLKEWLNLLVARLCQNLWDPVDCSPPGFSVCGIFQARITKWVAIAFSKGSSWPRNPIQVSRTVGKVFTIWATRETWWNYRGIILKFLRHSWQTNDVSQLTVSIHYHRFSIISNFCWKSSSSCYIQHIQTQKNYFKNINILLKRIPWLVLIYQVSTCA